MSFRSAVSHFEMMCYSTLNGLQHCQDISVMGTVCLASERKKKLVTFCLLCQAQTLLYMYDSGMIFLIRKKKLTKWLI